MKEAKPEISVQDLVAQGYQEDRDGRRDFERPYGWITIPCLLLFLGAYPLARYVIHQRFPQWDWGIVCFCLGATALLGLGGTHLHALRKIPNGRANGLPLARYKRIDIDHHKVQSEYVYVDHTRKTYFTRVFAWKSKNGGWQ